MLLFVVPDSVIQCSASALLGLNVLALQDDMGRPIGPMWDIHLFRAATCLTGTEGHSVRSLIEFRTEARSTAPVMQLLALSEEQSGRPVGAWMETIAGAHISPEEQLLLAQHGVVDELAAWKRGADGLKDLGLKLYHTVKLFVASCLRVLEVGCETEKATATEQLAFTALGLGLGLGSNPMYNIQKNRCGIKARTQSQNKRL
jgi:hypothetical protein